MRLLFYSPEPDGEWPAALERAAAERGLRAELRPWPEAEPCDYALVWRPPAALFAAQPGLKAAFALGAGVDSLLANPGLPPGLPIYRIEDAGMAAQMAEYALYVCLEKLRGFDGYRAAQAAGRWAPGPYRSRAGFKAAVLGLGALGSAVARALSDFGFTVGGWSRRPKELPGVHCHAGPEGLLHCLADAELVVALLPLSDETRGLLGERELSALPQGAWLVNLARGPVVREEALLKALDEGRIGRAYLDVFSEEPPPADSPWWAHPRVAMTPHIAALTPPAASAAQIMDKIAALEAGLPASGLVDRGSGY